ncbi:hypothetical protein FS837_000263 [Tulasnella sp. UAMH 9824]|nr:hypothetical protein FS837_000263 [Tulasnella sp. UAMH 9824]
MGNVSPNESITGTVLESRTSNDNETEPVDVPSDTHPIAEEFERVVDDITRSRIEDLPPELFLPILQIALPQGEKGYYHQLLPKRRVSKRWLAFIDSCPTLWSYIYPGPGEGLLQMIMQNSGEHLLDVDLDDEGISDKELNSFFEHVTPHYRRWSSCSFRGESSLDLSHLINRSLPNLRQLTVDVTPMKNTYLMWPAAIAAPLLLDVKLYSCGLKWESLRGLRKLEIYSGGPCAEDLAELLSASPDIERLVIIDNWKLRDNPPTTTSIQLSRLRTLVVKRSGTPTSIAWLLRSINVPRLEGLIIQPVHLGRFTTLSELQELFASVGFHAGSCAARTQPSVLQVIAGVERFVLEHGKSRIVATITEEPRSSDEWAGLAKGFVQSLPPEARGSLTTLRITAQTAAIGLSMVIQLLPILPGVRALGVEHMRSKENHDTLAIVLKEQFGVEGQRDCHVYLRGGILMRQDKESLENLVAALHLQNVTEVDSLTES